NDGTARRRAHPAPGDLSRLQVHSEVLAWPELWGGGAAEDRLRGAGESQQTARRGQASGAQELARRRVEREATEGAVPGDHPIRKGPQVGWQIDIRAKLARSRSAGPHRPNQPTAGIEPEQGPFTRMANDHRSVTADRNAGAPR